MSLLRRLIAQRTLAALILAAALLLKLLVPTGYMIATDHGHIAITTCPGAMPQAPTMAMAGMHDTMPGHGKSEQGKTEMPCAFAGLSAQALGAVDPILLVALIGFILAVVRVQVLAKAPRTQAFLRPPLRGPPAYR